MLKNKKQHSFRLLALVAIMQTNNTFGDYGTTDNVPGSWWRTCSDARIVRDKSNNDREVLKARCLDASGYLRDTEINLATCSANVNVQVQNCNGGLRCESGKFECPAVPAKRFY